MMDIRIRKYKKDSEYSYTLGAAPTVELISKKPEAVYRVYFHPSYRPAQEDADLRELCQKRGISCEISESIFSRVAQKENVFVIGVFFKYAEELDGSSPHVLLVNPSDAGNLGTIMRTALGFNYGDIAVITPCADFFEPKVLRASMGAFFSLRVRAFDSFDCYRRAYSERAMFCLMLTGSSELSEIRDIHKRHTLVFGNEATGLPSEYAAYGKAVRIGHSACIDSLNLAVAFGITARHFDIHKSKV